MSDGFEWDEVKRLANLEKHELDFADTQRMFDAGVVLRPSTFQAEARVLATGMLDGDWVTVVFTWRNRQRRVISMRKARRNERRGYR